MKNEEVENEGQKLNAELQTLMKLVQKYIFSNYWNMRDR